MVTRHYSLGAGSSMDLHLKDELEKAIEAELVLGVASRACRGNGICSFYTKGSLGVEKHYCHFADVKIKRDYRERLLFSFFRNSMRKSTMVKHFQATHFKIEETVNIPGFIKRGLHLEREIIKKGKYPIWEFGNTIQVVFP